MSETPRNDMEHDARLAALYRAAAHDEPPPALDDAIRAAARRAVASRPRPAGATFGRAWRGPLSIAAVLVLAVSLVIVMREEAPQFAELPRADTPMTEAERKPAAAAGDAAVPKTILAPDVQRSGNIGLKPPPTASPAMGIRSEAESPAADALLRKESAASSAPPLAAKRAAAEAFPGRTDTRDKQTPSANQPREHSNMQSRGDFAVAEPLPAQAKAARQAEAAAGASATPGAAPRAAEVGSMSEPNAQTASGAASADSAARESAQLRMQSAPAAKPAAPPAAQFAGAMSSYANLPPEKWLERIEELRKQGRLDEAKTSLAEFRQRFPDHPLPASLKEWAQP